MRKHPLRLLFAMLFVTAISKNSFAQYVTIPDTAFVNWLQTGGYGSCMAGNQLDTTCQWVTGPIQFFIVSSDIRDLDGIQYFDSAVALICFCDSLVSIPSFPPSLHTIQLAKTGLQSLPPLPSVLTNLSLENNKLTSIPALPATLIGLACGNTYDNAPRNQLTGLPALPAGLKALSCQDNLLTALPTLPDSLLMLRCENNQISILPNLPPVMQDLDCSNNPIYSLPLSLPSTITRFFCDNDSLSTMPALPASLEVFRCAGNLLTSLPTLPPNLSLMDCSRNMLPILPPFPPRLQVINCSQNQLEGLPAFNSYLQYIACNDNPIAALPAMPNALGNLECMHTLISSIPALPPITWALSCGYNANLTSLPALPSSMRKLDIDSTPNLSCIPWFNHIDTFSFTGCGAACFPTYGDVPISTPSIFTLPLCDTTNPYGCLPYFSLTGGTYHDANADCIHDGSDTLWNGVKLQLFSAGTLVQQVYSGLQGGYAFTAPPGIYTVIPDTSDLPFVVGCGNDAGITDTLSAANPISANNDFALQCPAQGFDLGLLGQLNPAFGTRPGFVFNLVTYGGDMTQFYGAHCGSGIAGQVKITISGPCTYSGPASGALTPSNISGNTITWNVADFGAIDIYSAFNLNLLVDTTAQMGDQICFDDDIIASTSGDYDITNNASHFCITVNNSHDPNAKEVFPATITIGDTLTKWLTYTIHFQNTGTADAINIRIADTLDNNVDPATFRLLAASHENITQLSGNIVTFNFPNIYLADSTHNEPQSHGYIQYKIKLKDNLPVNTQIKNTAAIYFDFNSAVFTNTATTTIEEPNAIQVTSTSARFGLFPNPATGVIFIQGDISKQVTAYRICDVTGRIVSSRQVTGLESFDVSQLNNGMYTVEVSTTEGKRLCSRFVKE
jgi:uncharacterized repeat protein (TIGR01451 family)